MKPCPVLVFSNGFNSEGREVISDDTKSGCPKTSRNTDVIEKVRQPVASKWGLTLKMMETEINTHKSMKTILQKDLLKSKVCSKFVPHNLKYE